ncbi:MAG: NAD-dependent epimerase/dehydratase family protein, partial [Acidobacteriaceae bacterium]|nr:NAD-dependent epimerase/dehydratase family protein [Acidobacteriaceae bacterium]
MNYMITGATGFVGSQLVHTLLSQGQSVNYVGRKRSTSLDSRAAYHRWDMAEEPPLDSLGRLDAIIHLAGEPVSQRWNTDVKKRIYSTRVESTRKLVWGIAGLKHKPQVLVSASAIGYYGDRGDEVLTEDSGPGTGFLADLCVAWEREAARAREFG